MKFTDFRQFATKYPEIAKILEHPHHAFLAEMKERIVAGKNLTPKQMKALKRWAEREKATSKAGKMMPRVGDVIRDQIVKITKVYTSRDEGVLIVQFEHPDGWKGRIKNVTNPHVLLAIRGAGFTPAATKGTSAASSGTPFNLRIDRAHVTWAKPEAAFVILAKPRRSPRGSAAHPLVSMPTTEPTPVPEPEPIILAEPAPEPKIVRVKTPEPEPTPEPTPEPETQEEPPEKSKGPRGKLLPNFSDWRSKLTL